MSEPVQTWHYGLMARHWAENSTTRPEIAYYQQQIEQYGVVAQGLETRQTIDLV